MRSFRALRLAGEADASMASLRVCAAMAELPIRRAGGL